MNDKLTITTKTIFEKLDELNCPIDDIVLGDFDAIGEFTAKKSRTRDNPLYKTAGCFFRPNYERGLLAYAMIRRYRPQRILEIGFGRGYWSVVAAKTLHELGIDGTITTIDVNFDDNVMKMIAQLFPEDWLKRIKPISGTSADVVPKLEGRFDLVYIDGDHTYQGVSSDWNVVKDRFDQFCIFDDYHKTKQSIDIDVARLIDEIDDHDKELILMDRMVFNDDRGDVTRDYGQVIVKSPTFVDTEYAYTYDW